MLYLFVQVNNTRRMPFHLIYFSGKYIYTGFFDDYANPGKNGKQITFVTSKRCYTDKYAANVPVVANPTLIRPHMQPSGR